MVQRVGGFRRKTRYKLSKNHREKGKISLTKYFQEFNVGDRVKLLAEPAIQTGMYFPRFHGLVGTVENKKGHCYNIIIKDKNKQKCLIVHPVHLTKVN
jgi:large subunit ribosomal protein L21e